jgi:hypothetical protein
VEPPGCPGRVNIPAAVYVDLTGRPRPDLAMHPRPVKWMHPKDVLAVRAGGMSWRTLTDLKGAMGCQYAGPCCTEPAGSAR